MTIWDTIRGIGIALIVIAAALVITYELMNRASK